jgi:hypothetical protein
LTLTAGRGDTQAMCDFSLHAPVRRWWRDPTARRGALADFV